MRLSPVEEFRGLAVSVTAMFAMWLVFVAISRGGLVSNQMIFLVLAYVFSMITLPVFRGTARRLLAIMPWWGFPTLVCGDDAVAVKVYHWLAANQRLGLRPVGVIADPDVLETGVDEPWYAGRWSDAHEVARRGGVYWAVVVPPDGDMATYMASLDKLRARDDRVYYPAHGPPVTRPRQYVRGLVGHRLQREKQILRLVGEQPRDIPDIVANAYPGLDPRLVAAAGGSVYAHLLDLQARGLVDRQEDRWTAA